MKFNKCYAVTDTSTMQLSFIQPCDWTVGWLWIYSADEICSWSVVTNLTASFTRYLESFFCSTLYVTALNPRLCNNCILLLLQCDISTLSSVYSILQTIAFCSNVVCKMKLKLGLLFKMATHILHSAKSNYA